MPIRSTSSHAVRSSSFPSKVAPRPSSVPISSPVRAHVAFDAKKLAAATSEGPKLVAWGGQRMARFYEALTPVLTPDQRTKVADKLRQRGNEPKSKETP